MAKKKVSYFPIRLLGLSITLLNLLLLFFFSFFTGSSFISSMGEGVVFVYESLIITFFTLLEVSSLLLFFFPATTIDLFDITIDHSNMTKTWLCIIGIILLLYGFTNLFLYFVGVYRPLCDQSEFLYFTLMVLSFLFIYVGFIFVRFRDWVASWIRNLTKKKNRPFST